MSRAEAEQRIVNAAIRCERELRLADTYRMVGDDESVLDCLSNAEADSFIAFRSSEQVRA